MDYNELKLPVLQTLLREPSLDSETLLRKLAESKTIAIDIHALRMALMRYYKQGLLTRQRSGGVYVYALSLRGSQRLQWLEKQTELK